MSCQINGDREGLWLEHTALWLASILVRESSSPSYGAVRAGTDELGEWGSHKSVPSSFLVQSKPQQRRQSGPCSFDILEGLHPNLLVKEVLFFSLPLMQPCWLYSIMHALKPLLYSLIQTPTLLIALYNTQDEQKQLPGNQTLCMTKESCDWKIYK